MMMNDGMLVSLRWLMRADEHINRQDALEGMSYYQPSRFFDVRPAQLQSAWQQNEAGAWYATACFLVNDVVDTSFTFYVFAPLATAKPGGVAGTARFFVVWRGRWEMVASAVAVQKSPVIETVSLVKKDFLTKITTSYSTILTDVGVTTAPPYKDYIVGVDVDSRGRLVFQTRTEGSVALQKENASAVTLVTTEKLSGVTEVNTTKKQVVTDVT